MPEACWLMWQRLLELMEDVSDRKILVVGDLMLDRYLYGDAERISPEAPVPVLRVIRQEDALGGAGSVVADIAALGARPYCVGVVGTDSDATLMKKLLGGWDAHIGGVVAVEGRPTTRKTRLIGLAQHRHRQQLIRVDDESTDPLANEVTDALLAHVERGLETCQVVCMEDYGKGVVTPRLTQSVIEAARRRGRPVLIDPAKIDDYSSYSGATMVTPNRGETEKVLGARLGSVDAVRSAAKDILARCRTEYVCVTLDAEGAALIGPNGTFAHVPTRARDVYDVTGAGDEMLAMLAVAIAGGAAMSEAVALANVAAGLEVEKFGCVPIRREEVLGEILLEHHRAAGKVRALEQLLPELSRRRATKCTVGFTNGCFDLLHAGHVANFAYCKRHCDLLVIGLNSDASVRRQAKGDGRPIVGQEDRAALLAAIEDVDYVVPFDDDTPQRLIEAIRPDVLFKGEDWADKQIVGQEFVERSGGRVLLVPLLEGRSTTSLIQRIRKTP